MLPDKSPHSGGAVQTEPLLFSRTETSPERLPNKQRHHSELKMRLTGPDNLQRDDLHPDQVTSAPRIRLAASYLISLSALPNERNSQLANLDKQFVSQQLFNRMPFVHRLFLQFFTGSVAGQSGSFMLELDCI